MTVPHTIVRAAVIKHVINLDLKSIIIYFGDFYLLIMTFSLAYDRTEAARVLQELQGTSFSQVTHPQQYTRASTRLVAKQNQTKINKQHRNVIYSVHSHIHYLPTVSILNMALPAWRESQHMA